MTFGEKLLELRKQNNFSQEELAEKLGVSSKAVDNALQHARRKVGGIDMS